MEQMTGLKWETLRKQAKPVYDDDIIDLVQVNMFGKIGKGICGSEPLTDRGKRIQLLKILCLTVIPILGVWGFTMQSLSVSVQNKANIQAAQNSMAVVVMLGKLIHRLQRERDMSVLYLSDLGPGTKTFLLQEYMETDDALQRVTSWPVGLEENHREEFWSKKNMLSYISQHRASLNPAHVDLFEEIDFYSKITSTFLAWLVDNIKGSGSGSTWKTLVAYQKITQCKEDIGVERAYGTTFYATGTFEKWVDYEFYNEKIHDFKYNYKTAVFYSDIVIPLHTDEVNELRSTGLNITKIIFDYRREIQFYEMNQSYVSEEKAKWFFDNMTTYLDSLLKIQNEVAYQIQIEVDDVLYGQLIKVTIYAILVVVVISMCPVIMMAANALSSEIQIYTLTLVEKTKELNLEKSRTDTLLYQMVPKSIAERLKNCGQVESEFFKSVTIFFSDIYDFSAISMSVAPMDLVELLNSLYTSMDERIENYDVYKVETINDSYIVASGLPTKNGDRHAPEIAALASDLLNMMKQKTFPESIKHKIQLRIGINTGSIMAGIVGNIMLRYCLFGDTMNTASRMRTYGAPNKIHISESTYMALKKIGGFRMKFRGNLNIKGKGIMKTFWIVDETWDDLDVGVKPNTSFTSDSNLPGELMAYSTAEQRRAMKTDSEFSVWKEEDVFLSGCKLMIDCT